VLEAYVAAVNSRPGILTYSGGQLVSVAGLEIAEGRISAIYSVSNPDKIGHSGDLRTPVSGG